MKYKGTERSRGFDSIDDPHHSLWGGEQMQPERPLKCLSTKSIKQKSEKVNHPSSRYSLIDIGDQTMMMAGLFFIALDLILPSSFVPFLCSRPYGFDSHRVQACSTADRFGHQPPRVPLIWRILPQID